jgi:hypothetical protein
LLSEAGTERKSERFIALVFSISNAIGRIAADQLLNVKGKLSVVCDIGGLCLLEIGEGENGENC